MDTKRVNAAVKIKIALIRQELKHIKLGKDLLRLVHGMTNEEYNEYHRRIQ